MWLSRLQAVAYLKYIVLFGLQALLNGMDSIVKVLQYFRDQKKYQDVIDGYYGTLIENFECDKTFFTAVEVTAGNRWDEASFKILLFSLPSLVLGFLPRPTQYSVVILERHYNVFDFISLWDICYYGSCRNLFNWQLSTIKKTDWFVVINYWCGCILRFNGASWLSFMSFRLLVWEMLDMFCVN